MTSKRFTSLAHHYVHSIAVPRHLTPSPRRPWMTTPNHREADLLVRSAARMADQQPGEAWRVISRALEIDPDHAGGWIVAGGLWLLDWDAVDDLEESERTEHLGAAKALHHFDRALSIEPLHAEAWSGRARALCRLGRYDEALVAVDGGLKSLPHGVDHSWSPATIPFIHRELIVPAVEALLGLGRRDEAWEVLQAAMERYPGQGYLEQLMVRFAN